MLLKIFINAKFINPIKTEMGNIIKFPTNPINNTATILEDTSLKSSDKRAKALPKKIMMMQQNIFSK